MADVLNDQQIDDELSRLPGWTRVGDEIHATYASADFVSAIALVDAVASLAEEAQHHPDIDIRYSKVSFALSTHSAGGLTAKDFELAARIDAVAAAAGAAPANS